MTRSKCLSRLGVLYRSGGITLDKVRAGISNEIRRKADAETTANLVLLRPLLITSVFSVKKRR